MCVIVCVIVCDCVCDCVCVCARVFASSFMPHCRWEAAKAGKSVYKPYKRSRQLLPKAVFCRAAGRAVFAARSPASPKGQRTCLNFQRWQLIEKKSEGHSSALPLCRTTRWVSVRHCPETLEQSLTKSKTQKETRNRRHRPGATCHGPGYRPTPPLKQINFIPDSFVELAYVLQRVALCKTASFDES